MEQKQHTIAIVFFANTSTTEVLNKPFVKNKELFSFLNSQTLNRIKKLSVDVIVYNESLQIGTSFAERFTNAIDTVFKQGYTHIITIGNDTPGLTNTHLKTAISHLVKGKNILGPSVDGGVYLIGLQKTSFNKQQFLSISWQTGSVYSDLRKLLNHDNTIECLEYLRDIDNYRDLIYLLGTLSPNNALLSIISKLLFTENKVFNNHTPYSNLHFQDIYYNKGSPLLIFFSKN